MNNNVMGIIRDHFGSVSPGLLFIAANLILFGPASIHNAEIP